MSNERPSTARITPRWVQRWVRRPRTARTGSGDNNLSPRSEAGIERVIDSIAKEVESENRRGQDNSWRGEEVWLVAPGRQILTDHCSPGRAGGLDPNTEEAKR